MKFAITGFSCSGKTALFSVLTGIDIETARTAGRVHQGVAVYEDENLARIAEIFRSKKITPATAEHTDTQGAADSEGLKRIFDLPEFRSADAHINVVRAFGDNPQPAEDAKNMEAEFVLADLASVEKRIEKLDQQLKKAKTPLGEKELALLYKCKGFLENGTSLRVVDLDKNETDILRGYSFLSQKPVLHIINLSEEAIKSTRSFADSFPTEKGAGIETASLQIEYEMAQMTADEARPFMEDLGLTALCKKRVLASALRTAGLISFYTANEKETRSWLVPEGATAVEAAGKIHSDFARGFIRAEIIPAEKLLEIGSLTEARQKGILRAESKDAILKNADFVQFKIHV